MAKETMNFSAGFDAFENGLRLEDNVFDPVAEQDEYESWMMGWKAAEKIYNAPITDA